MEVTILGTGTSTGIPMIGCPCPVCHSTDPRDNRTRTSAFIEMKGVKLIIDTGPDFRSQLLREGIDDVDAVLFTHSHKDHLAGLDDIRAINYIRQKEVFVYASPFTMERLKLEYHYAFEQTYPGVPIVSFHLIEEDVFEFKEVKIELIHGLHGNMPILGFKINDFAYLTDFNFISEEEKDKLRGIKVMVLNSLHKRKHYSHYNLEESLAVLEDIKPEKAYLTHLNHWMGKHADVEKELPENVKIAFDGLKITV